ARGGGDPPRARAPGPVKGGVGPAPGPRADPAPDAIALDGRPVGPRGPTTHWLLHKPRGYVTSVSDPAGRPVVVDLLPAGAPRLFPLGRLDYHGGGGLLLTNDGHLANHLLQPRYQHPPVYQAE